MRARTQSVDMAAVWLSLIIGLVVIAAMAYLISGTTALAMDKVPNAVAVLHPTQGSSVSGTVHLTQESGGVRVTASVDGLAPGKHGFHIHEIGDCSAPDGTSAGGHFNPQGYPHAGPDAAKRHVGDLGNLNADNSGHATYDRLDDHVSLNGANTVIGRAVIVHAGKDDFVSQPTGNAGGRVACGVIGIGKH